jgi:hypothetical protein
MLGHEAALEAILGTKEPADGPFCMSSASGDDDAIPAYNFKDIKAFLSSKNKMSLI